MTKQVPRPAGRGDPRLTPEVIDRRLRELAQLHRLGISLKGGRWLGPSTDSGEEIPEGEAP